METIRNRLIHHGSTIHVVDGVCRIRLNRVFPYPSEVLDTLQALRQQVRVQKAHKAWFNTRQDSDMSK